jgi:hypothetical protein
VNFPLSIIFFLSRQLIQPGHGRITVGSCIAADVHGNHAKDGTFINQVVGLTLFHPDQGMIEVSPIGLNCSG